jgi:hypothetical protein
LAFLICRARFAAPSAAGYAPAHDHLCRDNGIDIQSAAYLFNLARQHPEPLEDPRYRHIIDESRLFLTDDADELSRFIERHVRHRSRHDVLYLLEKGRVVPAPALVDGLSLPWNFSGENWATATDGIEQVGCVHTCQGVEFDWLGVLIGPDLRFENGRVVQVMPT